MKRHLRSLVWGLLGALVVLGLPLQAQIPPVDTITVGKTNVSNGTNGMCLYQNGTKVGEQACSTGSVSTFSAGTTGFTPSSPTSGAVTLAGTLAGANGGTGVANSGKTITLGGNLTTSGAFASTFTMTNTTGVTFPTTGTLATLAGTETLTNKSIGLVAVNETFTAPAITANVLTIDLSTGTVFNVANTANITTFTISNATASKASSFTLILTANGSAFTQAWGASVVWANGAAPVLTTTNAKRDILTFVTNDGGTTWFGMVGGQGF